MPNRRDRHRRPGRRAPFLEPKPVILIVCEGEKTEKQYFEGFARDFRTPVDVKIAPEHGVPKTLVVTAKRYKKKAEDAARKEDDENRAYDAVWCVFDVDDHPQVADARQMAQANGIELAISNPCFELWLLLHFRDSPGMQPRETMRRMLSRYVPGYDKRVEFTVYAEGYPQAVKRAEQMDKKAEEDGDSGRNPTTGVYRLTREIERKE
jgi:hypothetical protein